MDEAKIKEVFSDEEFVKSLLKLETPEEVQAALEPKGVQLSTQEICQLREIIIKMTESGQAELTEEDLAQVAGGSIVVDVLFGICLGAAVLGIGAGVTDWLTEGRW